MNLFTETEGLSGEELATALLRYLILRSPELRDQVIQSISSRSQYGPLISQSHFSCYTEYATEDPEHGSGRIDLVIEVDDAVIGIESKLFAAFQSGQPDKYEATLKELAERLGQIRPGPVTHLLAIICPKGRVEKIKKCSPSSAVVPWEELLNEMAKASDRLDPTIDVILSQFTGYIQNRIGFLPRFIEWLPHLRRRFDPRGTSLQRDVIGAIWSFFPDSGPRMSCGATWSGYYFYGQDSSERGWYGFVPKAELKEDSARDAELIIITTCAIEDFSSSLKPVELSRPSWLGRNSCDLYAWIIDFDDSWNTSSKWADELKPLWQ